MKNIDYSTIVEFFFTFLYPLCLKKKGEKIEMSPLVMKRILNLNFCYLYCCSVKVKHKLNFNRIFPRKLQ